MRSFSALPVSLVALLAADLSYAAASAQGAAAGPDGLQIEDVNGTLSCPRPTRNGDEVMVHYRGSLLATGQEFDASYNRGSPFSFMLGKGRVIKGWDEGLLNMCPGQSRTLTIPPELGYGSRGAGKKIPPGATLVFDTKLVEIVGINEEDFAHTTTTAQAPTRIAGEDDFHIATAPPSPTSTGFKIESEEELEIEHELEIEEELEEGLGGQDDEVISDSGQNASASGDESAVQAADEKQAECSLLGPFALVVQGALGALALLTLVWKRWRETPKRPWKIFIFDVSKQVLGSMLTHVINLAMSMVSSVDMANAAAHAVSAAGAQAQDKEGRTPNPCSFYLLNLGIDTTLGVPVLYLLLIILHALFLRTPLAKPPQSIKSGKYGNPPRITWYFKQLLIYCIGLVGMKLFVFFLLVALPWLPWIGDWALRWTQGNEKLEVAFALFVFPLAMNAIQYWVIDNLIMDKQKTSSTSSDGYQQVAEDDEGAEPGSGAATRHTSLTGHGNDGALPNRDDALAAVKRDSDELFVTTDDDLEEAETSSISKPSIKRKNGQSSS